MSSRRALGRLGSVVVTPLYVFLVLKRADIMVFKINGSAKPLKGSKESLKHCTVPLRNYASEASQKNMP